MTDDLVVRLREAHQTSQQRIVGSNIFAEAADCLEVERAARAKAENERDDASKALEDLLDPKVQSMRLENGKFDVVLCGEVVQRLAVIVTGWFRESGAKNYVEMTLNARDEPFERYTFIVQKRGDGAQSPHELRLAAEARVRELEAMVTRLHDELDVANANHRQMAKQLADAYERCAKVAETEGTYPELNVWAGGPEWYRHGLRVAAAIRQLAQVKHEAE